MAAMVTASGAAAMAEPASLLRTIENPHGEEFWGVSLAPCGDGTFLAASRGSTTLGNDVPIYRLNALTGQVVQTYTEPSLPEYSERDLFGSGMALVNDYVMVGTFSDGGPGISQDGDVHVYDANTGVHIRTLHHPDPITSGSFGMSIVPIGNLAIVGTFEEAGLNGAAYIIDPATGSVELKIERPSGSSTDHFGSSVGTIQDDALIGGMSSTVYRFDATAGTVKTTYDDPGMGGLFGFAVAGAGDKVLVGAFKASGEKSEEGVFHVYDADSGVLLQTVPNPHPAALDWFGIEIEVYDDRYALVGAALDSSNGAAYLYDLEDMSLLAEFPNPDPEGYSRERFGQNIAWVGEAAVISAYRDEGYDGAIYVFEGFTPEPSTLMLLAFGGLSLLKKRRK